MNSLTKLLLAALATGLLTSCVARRGFLSFEVRAQSARGPRRLRAMVATVDDA